MPDDLMHEAEREGRNAVKFQIGQAGRYPASPGRGKGRKALWAARLTAVGGAAMILGALDPLEGSLVILAGCGLILAGAFMGEVSRPPRTYWAAVFALVALGVGAMFVLSFLGGVGGGTGRSLWWGLVVLPYPIGWLLGVGGLLIRLRAGASRKSAAGPAKQGGRG